MSHRDCARLFASLLLCSRAVGLVLFVFVSKAAAAERPSTFSGPEAFAYTRRATSFGERPSGSAAIKQLRDWIVSELKPLGGELSIDSFQASTPTGPTGMANLILKFPGTSGRAVAVTGHYDTKHISMVHFVGANDGGSSTGFLIEFARAAARIRHPDDLYIVFFDGEEAVNEWTATDSCYGSRHLASKWGADGTLARVKALINVDMIGDKDLDILADGNSAPALRELFLQSAAKLNFSKYFHTNVTGIDDDHMPFVASGVNSIDIIDFSYGPSNAYWHTAQDTLDKLSSQSLQIVGNVVLSVVGQLEKSS